MTRFKFKICPSGCVVYLYIIYITPRHFFRYPRGGGSLGGTWLMVETHAQGRGFLMGRADPATHDRPSPAGRQRTPDPEVQQNRNSREPLQVQFLALLCTRESPSGNSKNGLPMGPDVQQGRDYAGPEGAFRRKQPFRHSGTHAPPLLIAYTLKRLLSMLIVHCERRNTTLHA